MECAKFTEAITLMNKQTEILAVMETKSLYPSGMIYTVKLSK